MLSHVIEEAASDSERFCLTGLQVLLEVQAVEVVQFLQVTEDASALTAQILRDVRPGQQGEVVSQDVAERADVLHLCQQELLHDAMKLSAGK